jgi:hypothetical protein
MVKWLAAVAIVASVLVLPAAAAVPRLVTGVSIGGVGLGLKQPAYVRAIGEAPTRIRLPAGQTKLVFANAALTVTLGTNGRGLAIETNAQRYVTRQGSHPCGPIRPLMREFGTSLKTVRERTTRATIALRSGNLTFSISSAGRIGSIMLAAPSIPATVASNSAQCGSGEEGK